MWAGTVARKEQRAGGPEGLLVTENTVQSQHLSRPFLWPSAVRGTGWPCHSVATVGLLGKWEGTLNNSAGTTGRDGGQDMELMLLHPKVPLYLPDRGPFDSA